MDVTEWQILSSLLNHLAVDADDPGVDTIDWGTLLVYTCPANCAPPAAAATGPWRGYRPERVWRQQFSPDALPPEPL
jgi:hypothetical protein